MTITEPGIYTLTAEAYHADPALGSTGARLLVNECPAAYRLNVSESKTEFDIGTAAHLLVLEPDAFGAKVAAIPFDSYRTKAAQEARDAARVEGRTPLLPDQLAAVQAMRDAILADPVAGRAFQGGAAEQSLFWRDPEFGVICKTRPDWLPGHGRYLVDIKTSTNANPKKFEKAIAEFGYHQQAAWYLDGVEAVTGTRPARFAFVVVSKKAPHLVTTCWIDDEAIQWGRILNRRARGLFAWCLEHDQWPAFQPDIIGQRAAFTVGLPHWAKTDLERRHEAGEFTPPQEIAA